MTSLKILPLDLEKAPLAEITKMKQRLDYHCSDWRDASLDQLQITVTREITVTRAITPKYAGADPPLGLRWIAVTGATKHKLGAAYFEARLPILLNLACSN